MGETWRIVNVKRISFFSIVCICFLLVAGILLLGSGQSLAQSKAGQPKTLKIGYLLCLTDWFSVFDATEELNQKTVAQIFNERGGLTIKGQKYKVELVGEDGKSTLDGITAGATKLVYDDNVKFVVGPQGFFGTASAPVFEQNKVLHVSGYNTCQPGEMDKTTPYGFLGFNASIGTSICAFKAIKKEWPDAKKIAVVTADDGAIPYLMPRIKKLLKSNGLTMVGDTVGFPNQMEDFSPIGAKLNAIKEADAYFMLNGSPIAAGLIAKSLRALGNNKPYVHQGAPHVKEIMAIAGKEASNNIISFGPTPHAPGNPPILDEIYDRSSKIRDMPSFYLLTPNGLYVLLQVIQAADSLDPTVVKAKWESMDGVDSLYGKATFGGDETYGLKHHAVGHPMSYSKLVDGKVVYGGWVDPGRIP
jgi:branched-chain amino acid transport system substrate-binding protein